MRTDWFGLAGGIMLVLALAFVFSGPVPVQAGSCVNVVASWYGKESCVNRRDCRTANGERFTGNDYTAAHRTLPFGTRLRVTYHGKSVVVRVNDRGPARWTGASLDLSRAAARKIGLGKGKVCMVRL